MGQGETTEEPRPDDRVLAILGYHKIGPPSPGGWETWYSLPEAQFVAHLESLREDGWEAIDLATLLAGLRAPDRLPARAVLLTFDDGYRSLLDAALPHLVRFGYPAIVFVPTDYIGGTNAFDADTAEPVEAICGWDDLRELELRGVVVQPHGSSHRRFSSLEPAEREQELRRSRDVLVAGLGRPAEVFAFPYGDDGGDLEAIRPALARLGYRAACLYGGGPNRLPIADVYRLQRVAMGPDTDLRAELAR
jgi:peptidoglycan/xylan/chitin deacetylase (PgdA/CDA1 family)